MKEEKCCNGYCGKGEYRYCPYCGLELVHKRRYPQDGVVIGYTYEYAEQVRQALALKEEYRGEASRG